MPQHTSTSLNSATIRTTYWTDTFGTSRQFVPVRTQVDVVRELHYKVGSILYKNCATYLQALQKVGLGMDLDSLTLSEDTKTYLDAEGINTIDQITNPNTYQCEISGVGGQWKATAISFLERFSQELYRMMPDADGAARQVAEAHKNAATIVAAGEKVVEQIKDRLTLADKTIASLEKVIDKAGLTMPQECMCGEIRDKEGETQVVVITPKKQLEVQINGTTTKGVWMCPQDVEYGEGLTYETVEIYDGVEGEYTVELSRPTWFAHKGDEEEGCCRNCILGDTANKGKCSPCFDPNPKKCPAVVGTQYGKAFEFYAPICPMCVNPLTKSNCFAWNKNRYLVCPQIGEVLKELIPKRTLRADNHLLTETLKPSEVKEIQEDGDVPVAIVRINTLGRTNYYGDYEYETGTDNRAVVRPAR